LKSRNYTQYKHPSVVTQRDTRNYQTEKNSAIRGNAICEL